MVLRSLILTLPLLLLSCGTKTQPVAAQPVETKKTPPVPLNPAADDFARFLAGLKGREGSPYKKFEKDNAWLQHGKAFDERWEKFDTSRYPIMKEFQKRELHGAPNAGGTLFYPFGGPDFLTAHTLFPGNSNYVLVGLEPAGTVRPHQRSKCNRQISRALPPPRPCVRQRRGP